MSTGSPFKLENSRVVYDNPWIKVREDRVTSADGKPRTFGVVSMKEGSSVLPIDSDRNVVLVREYKYGIDQVSTELMSGGFEKGENAEQAARRELREELGLEARVWKYYGYVDPFTTVVSSRNHLFIATDLVQGPDSPDEGESIERVELPLKAAVDMVLSGAITHSASCVLLLRAAREFSI